MRVHFMGCLATKAGPTRCVRLVEDMTQLEREEGSTADGGAKNSTGTPALRNVERNLSETVSARDEEAAEEHVVALEAEAEAAVCTADVCAQDSDEDETETEGSVGVKEDVANDEGGSAHSGGPPSGVGEEESETGATANRSESGATRVAMMDTEMGAAPADLSNSAREEGPRKRSGRPGGPVLRAEEGGWRLRRRFGGWGATVGEASLLLSIPSPSASLRFRPMPWTGEKPLESEEAEWYPPAPRPGTGGMCTVGRTGDDPVESGESLERSVSEESVCSSVGDSAPLVSIAPIHTSRSTAGSEDAASESGWADDGTSTGWTGRVDAFSSVRRGTSVSQSQHEAESRDAAGTPELSELSAAGIRTAAARGQVSALSASEGVGEEAKGTASTMRECECEWRCAAAPTGGEGWSSASQSSTTRQKSRPLSSSRACSSCEAWLTAKPQSVSVDPTTDTVELR